MGNTLASAEDPVTSKTTERGQSYSQKIHYAASGIWGPASTMNTVVNPPKTVPNAACFGLIHTSSNRAVRENSVVVRMTTSAVAICTAFPQMATTHAIFLPAGESIWYGLIVF